MSDNLVTMASTSLPVAQRTMFQLVLRKVWKRAPGAIMAGGAIRDGLARKEIKDLDVFIHAPTEEAFDDVANEIAEDFGNEITMSIPTEYRRWNHEVTGILGVHANYLAVSDVQLIGVKLDPFNMDTVLDRIDFGICQVGFDGNQIYATRAFGLDAVNKTFTLLRETDEDQHARCMQRWERLRKKYPDHKLVDTTQFAAAEALS